MEDDHGLNLTLSLKCPPPPPPPPQPQPLAPPSKLVSSLPLCPYTLIPSPFNSYPHNHQILPPPNYKPLSYAEMEKEMTAYIEEKRRQTAAMMMVKERERREVEEEVVVLSPPHSRSTVLTTSLSGNKRSVERGGENYEADRDLSPNYVVVSEDEDGRDTAVRKKLRLSKEQAAVLEETFKVHNTLSTKQKVALAKQLDLRPRQVEVWFQNRRARTKLKQTEVDCRYLKKCCQTLSEENKRLQKELAELRALKLSQMSYMNKIPPTTLAMCAQCVRVIACSSSSSSTQESSATVVGAASSNHPMTTSGIPFAKLISSDALDFRRPQP